MGVLVRVTVRVGVKVIVDDGRGVLAGPGGTVGDGDVGVAQAASRKRLTSKPESLIRMIPS